MTELPSLHDAVDPEALDRLIQSSIASESNLYLTFEYAGYQIAIRPDGTVRLTPQEA